MATLTRNGQFSVDYDRKGDVLYFSRGDPRPSESERHERGILVRFAFGEDAPSAVTVIGFRKNHWDQEIDNLATVIVGHVGGDVSAAAAAVTEVTGSGA